MFSFDSGGRFPFFQWSSMEHFGAMDGVAPFLPQEIITNILILLPVKSLIKFQCVCKYWKNLIKTPSFITAHLHHSTQRSSYSFPSAYHNGLQLFFLDCNMQIVKVLKLPEVDGEVWIVGSSNGLLCLQIGPIYGDSTSPHSYLLWNPAFREVRHVPFTFPDLDCNNPGVFGFGFSPIVNDYKIVTLYQAMDDDVQNHRGVYSLGVGSWKQIEVGILRGIFFKHRLGFTMDGSIFWFGYKQDCLDNSRSVMISFDIAMEEFALMPMPSVGLHLTRAVHIAKSEHRLALLYSPSTPIYNSCSVELWMLEKGTGGSGERWSWGKKYTSSPYWCLLTPIPIWRKEIVCICRRYLPCERSHHVETVMSNFTNIESNELFDNTYLSYNYVESLVPVSNIYVKES